MIVNFKINFTSAETKFFRMYSGAFVRGFLYWVLKKISRDLASKLHSDRYLAPFATSPVFKDGEIVNRLEEGNHYSFSISVFVKEIGEALKDYFVSIDKLYFAGGHQEVEKIEVKYVNVDELKQEAIRRFRIYFITPCYLRTPSNSYRFIPLPIPQLLFRSLARLWEAFIKPLPSEYRNWLDNWGIVVSGCNISSEKVLLRKGAWSVGFKGEALFSIPEDSYNEDFARITSSLLNFGRYSNVGGGRTSGLGMIDYDFS
jgi:CRISPR-associated endoribonuclease Cas6